jgi:hypothetical protein
MVLIAVGFSQRTDDQIFSRALAQSDLPQNMILKMEEFGYLIKNGLKSQNLEGKFYPLSEANGK